MLQLFKHYHKDLFRPLARLAFPLMLQALISTLLNLVDSVMLGGLGENELSAVSLANQLFSILFGFVYGFSAGACVLISQYWGKGDTRTIQRVFGIAGVFSVILGAFVTFFGAFAPKTVMSLFTDLPTLIDVGTEYLQIAAWSYVLAAVSNTLSNCLRGVEIVKVPLYTSTGAIGLNVLLNWVLIYGKLGAPALGVKGAALATLIARGLEFAVLLLYVFRYETSLRLKLREMLRFDRLLLKDYFRYALPVVLNEGLWGLGCSVQAAVMGRLSEAAAAGYAIAGTMINLAFVAGGGICNAVAVLLGKLTSTRSREYVHGGCRAVALLAVWLSVVMTAAMFLLAKPFLSLYTGLSATGYDCALQLLYVAAGLFLLKNTYAVLSNCLRGVGDSGFPTLLDTCGMWLVGLPTGAIAAFVFGAPVPLVYFFLMWDEIIKQPLIWHRVWGGKHIVDVTR